MQRCTWRLCCATSTHRWQLLCSAPSMRAPNLRIALRACRPGRTSAAQAAAQAAAGAAAQAGATAERGRRESLEWVEHDDSDFEERSFEAAAPSPAAPAAAQAMLVDSPAPAAAGGWPAAGLGVKWEQEVSWGELLTGAGRALRCTRPMHACSSAAHGGYKHQSHPCACGPPPFLPGGTASQRRQSSSRASPAATRQQAAAGGARGARRLAFRRLHSCRQAPPGVGGWPPSSAVHKLWRRSSRKLGQAP